MLAVCMNLKGRNYSFKGTSPCLQHKTMVLRRGQGVTCTPLLVTQNHRSVWQEGGDNPTICDTKPWYSTYKIHIRRTSGCVSLRERHALPLVRHKTTVLCRKQSSGHKFTTYAGSRHQKLRIAQSSNIAYNQPLGLGLDPKLRARDLNV